MSFLFRQLASQLPVVFGVCTLTFFMVHIVPGDPVDQMLGEAATIGEKQALREQLNLHLPLWQQYSLYIKNLALGDLGVSLGNRRSVSGLIGERFRATFELTAAAMALALLIALPMGVFSAVKKNQWPDRFSFFFSLSSLSTPGIFLGPLLIWIFAIQLDLFPVSDRNGVSSLILPALSLALPLSAVLMRLTRASLLEVIREDYIRVARAKGLSEPIIYFKHALKNAFLPILTVVGLQVGALLTGTVITETIFDWPGIGTLLYESIQKRDYPTIQGCTLVIALTYVSVHFLTDLLYGILNPKVRIGS